MSDCGEQCQARGGAEGLPADMRLVTQAQGSMSAVASVNICELRFRKCMETLIVLGGARTCNLRTAPNFTILLLTTYCCSRSRRHHGVGILLGAVCRVLRRGERAAAVPE